ncbi:MAG: PRD domain-containing protein [Defluviitaleaceae bacterium]|nr:PRD domain-containing protein [Defluviitaleaceae bacterium]
MTRVLKLLYILETRQTPINMSELACIMGLSQGTLRTVIRDVRTSKTPFKIVHIKGAGYLLQILDKGAFEKYKTELESLPVFHEPIQRLNVILFYMLQQEGFMTISTLEEKLMLSRSTIVKELKAVENLLAKYNLSLQRKSYHGIQVVGKEEDLRRAFSKYVLGSELYLEPTQEYKKIMDELNTGKIQVLLNKALTQNALTVNDIAFDNIVAHLKILAYRASKKNFIRSTYDHKQVAKQYRAAAKFLITQIAEEYGVAIPPQEEDFLAVHISSKINITELSAKENQVLYNNIDTVLNKLSNEFSTNFLQDEKLKEALLLHMFPALNRLHSNFELHNPLIEEIYTKYANVFMVAMRFSELIGEIYGFKASRDEVGYLTLHFATYFERLKQNTLYNIKRIVVICTTGGGSAHFLQLKLESIFPKTTIITTAQRNLEDFVGEMPDLFLSTIPLGDEYMGVPIIHITEFLNETEMQKIQNASYNRLSSIGKLEEYFYPEFFRIFQTQNGGAYLHLVQDQCRIMVERGFATQDFPAGVLEREHKFTTIYQNGVAGPHSTKLTALKNCIGVTILDREVYYMGKGVQIIFLINLMPGYLFLHKEVSRLLLHIIENESFRQRLLGAKTFEDFKEILDRL